MAFTFDSTSGGASANSYGSVSEADDYFDSFLTDLVSDWIELSTTQKQQVLVMATRILETVRFYGWATTTTQALQFPRYNLQNWEGSTYSSTAIPTPLKHAQFELALHLLQNGTSNVAESSDLGEMTNFSIGGVSVSYKRNEGVDFLPGRVQQLLKDIGPKVWKHNGRNRRMVL